jgi:hypothetical protein
MKLSISIATVGLSAAMTLSCSKMVSDGQQSDKFQGFSAPLVEVAVDSMEVEADSADAGAAEEMAADENGQFDSAGASGPEAETSAVPGGKSKSNKEKASNSKKPVSDKPKTKGNPKLDPEEASTCAGLTKGNQERLKVAGSHGVEQFTVEDVIAVKVTGNHNQVTITTKGAADKVIKGICVFIAGDLNKITIDVKSPVGYIYYKGRGNQSEGNIQVAKEGKVDRTYFDLAGNQAAVRFSGEGEYNCQDDSRLHGNDPRIVCNK